MRSLNDLQIAKQHDNFYNMHKDQFLEFFEKYYGNRRQFGSVREMAQQLASKYFSAQLKPRYSTENQPLKQIRKPPKITQPNQAILRAKEKFKARQEKILLLQKKLPQVPLRKVKSRSISVQPPSTSKCNTGKQTTPAPTFFLYALGEGNNHLLLKQVLDARENWVLSKDPNQKIINFRWQETERGYEYRTLVPTAKDYSHQLLNHFEFHQEISNKYFLATNFKAYCEKNIFNSYDYIPTTFAIEANTQSLKQALLPFVSFFRSNAPAEKLAEIDKHLAKNYLRTQTFYDQKAEHYPTLFGPQYLWIFKPSNMNQGRGIHIIRSIQDAIDVFSRYQNGYKEHLLEVKRNEQNEIVKSIVYVNTLQTEHFVIQKYIERPLLIDGRKFDVRVYLMLTMNLTCYIFREGQLRLATEKFDLSRIDNYVHLTNNAVQYNHPQYGKSEEGNQYSFDQASDYFKMDFRKEVIEKIKLISQTVLSSVKQKINKYKRKYCFEIFGLDYILDETFKPWLIEVNTNPSLEVTSRLLGALFPRLINDALKLTLDQLFPPSSQGCYQLMNYPEDQNLWECLGPLFN